VVWWWRSASFLGGGLRQNKPRLLTCCQCPWAGHLPKIDPSKIQARAAHPPRRLPAITARDRLTEYMKALWAGAPIPVSEPSPTPRAPPSRTASSALCSSSIDHLLTTQQKPASPQCAHKRASARCRVGAPIFGQLLFSWKARTGPLGARTRSQYARLDAAAQHTWASS
jgi:hypothetical protein